MNMDKEGVIITISLVVGAASIMAFMFLGLPKWNVWRAGLQGEAEFARAEQNRKIKVEEAQASLESAKYLSATEVERARGVAEANTIIGESLKGNDAYLRYLWIQGLQDGSGEIIYVPTEAQLPILEAGRLNK